MKAFVQILLFLIATMPLRAEKAEVVVTAPVGELSEMEKKFVGMWKGSRLAYRWEIHRREDRTFEIAFMEPDPDNAFIKLKNYATGVWWIEGEEYRYAWNEWWGDEGDLSGEAIEEIETVEADKVVTLSDDERDPRNVEVRVEKFLRAEWKMKPEKKPDSE